MQKGLRWELALRLPSSFTIFFSNAFCIGISISKDLYSGRQVSGMLRTALLPNTTIVLVNQIVFND